MKYYLLRGTVDKIEDHFFKAMLQIEPEVIEITKREYEEDRGIRPKGQGGKGGKDVIEPVGANTAGQQDASPLSGDNTKAEIIEEILRSGEFTRSELTRKNKGQLLEML
jgi:hypothetical protein